jgi:hypothetical protein
MTTQPKYHEDPALRKTIFANVAYDETGEVTEEKDVQVFMWGDGMCIQTKPGEMIILELDQTIELATFFFGTNIMKRVMDMQRRQRDRQRRAEKKRNRPTA